MAHCKALSTKSALAPLGSVRGRVIHLEAHDAALYVLHFQDDLHRATLTRVPRDGGKPAVVAHQDGPSEPKSWLMTDDAAYFTRKTNVYRVALETGELREATRGFTEQITVFDGRIYGVSCNPDARVDHLVRLSEHSDERESIAELPRVKVSRRASGSPDCDYGYLIGDRDTIFVSDWAGRRVLAVSLTNRTMRELTPSGSYPMRITPESETIVYQAKGGLYRVARDGGVPTLLAELANTPFASYVADPDSFWIAQTEAYAESNWIYRLARPSGKPEKLLVFKGFEGCSFPCAIVDAIAIDDECLYVAHRQEHTTSILARRKR